MHVPPSHAKSGQIPSSFVTFRHGFHGFQHQSPKALTPAPDPQRSTNYITNKKGAISGQGCKQVHCFAWANLQTCWSFRSEAKRLTRGLQARDTYPAHGRPTELLEGLLNPE